MPEIEKWFENYFTKSVLKVFIRGPK